jgi:hypothetical protein
LVRSRDSSLPGNAILPLDLAQLLEHLLKLVESHSPLHSMCATLVIEGLVEFAWVLVKQFRSEPVQMRFGIGFPKAECPLIGRLPRLFVILD